MEISENILEEKILIDSDNQIITFFKYPPLGILHSISESMDNPDMFNTEFNMFLEKLIPYFKKGYTFFIDESWEGHSWNTLLKEIPLRKNSRGYSFFNFLDKFRWKHNIRDGFFKIISNNLYYHFFNSSSYIYVNLDWLSDSRLYDSAQKMSNLINNVNKFDKKFIYLNRVPKNERVMLFDKIIKSDSILDNSYYSWNAAFEEDYWGSDRNWPNVTLENSSSNIGDEQSLLMDSEYYTTKSFCGIISESEIHFESISITEKTIKSILRLKPFVVLASPYYLKSMKLLGFKTFDNWWDESYDEEFDLNKRISKLYTTIEYINSKSMYELKTIYKEILPILKHNRELAFSINNGNIHKNITKKPKTFYTIQKRLEHSKPLEDVFDVIDLKNTI